MYFTYFTYMYEKSTEYFEILLRLVLRIESKIILKKFYRTSKYLQRNAVHLSRKMSKKCQF